MYCQKIYLVFKFRYHLPRRCGVLFREKCFSRGLTGGALSFYFDRKFMSDKTLTVAYSQLVMPQDANVIGTLFGGQMISWMDIAASKAAHRLLKGTAADAAVTRAIDATEFKDPVFVGGWVNFKATIVSLGTSSLSISVKAYAEGRHTERRLACIAEFTMVAISRKKDGTYQKVSHGKKIVK